MWGILEINSRVADVGTGKGSRCRYKKQPMSALKLEQKIIPSDLPCRI